MTDSLPARRDPTVLQMAAPLIVSFVMRSAFTFVDTIYAAIVGDAAVAAVGLTVPFEFVMIACWVGLSTGLTSSLSRAMGARAGKKIDQYLRATRLLTWIVSPFFLLVGAAIWFGAPQIQQYFPSLQLDEQTLQSFRVYGTVLIGGSAFTTFWSVIPDSLVKAHQDTRSTMWAGIWSNVANLGLNTLFLFVFHWGVFGIALSTVVGRVAGLLYALHKAREHENRRLAEARDTNLEPDPTPYKPILSLAVPASITFALMAAETAVINGLLAGLPDDTPALAAYSIYYRVTMFAMMPIIAISVAMLPFAAKRIGLKDSRGLAAGIRQSAVVSILYSVGIMGPLMFFFAEPLASWLAETPLTAVYTAFGLRVVPLASLLAAPFILCRPVFEAMGRGRPGLVMAIFRYVGLTVPAAYAGMEIARRMAQPEIYGIMLGLVAVGAIASLLFSVWLRTTLVRMAREFAAPAAGNGAPEPTPAS